MELDQWAEKEIAGLDELNATLRLEGLKEATAKECTDFVEFWKKKKAEPGKAHLYPLTDDGMGELFYYEMFDEWLDTGTVNETELKCILEDEEEVVHEEKEEAAEETQC